MLNITMDHRNQFYVRESTFVSKRCDCLRLDECAAEIFVSIPSRKSAYKAAKKGFILVNGKSSQPNSSVFWGAELTLLEPKKDFPKFFLDLNVIWEDEYLAVIEKPAGYPVTGNCFRTIQNALSINLKPCTVPDALPRFLPVHRLDVPTGGLLLVAKTRTSLVNLGRQFESQQVKKKYDAIVVGKLECQGEITEAIDGRSATSTFKVVEHTRSLHSKWITSVALFPRTGRTHQLRRHLAGIGHPIAGDTLYGEKGNVFLGKGLFLWAVALEFTHPISKKKVSISIHEPRKFRSYKAREARRWNRYNLTDKDRISKR